MTREEFMEGIQYWSELLDFCNDYDCDFCSNIYSEESMDDYINENLEDIAANIGNWRDFRNYLNDIETGHNYYIYDDDGWIYADEYDFENRKTEVLRWGDNEGIWDEEDEEDEYTEVLDETQEDILEEGCSIDELFSSGMYTMQEIKSKNHSIANN